MNHLPSIPLGSSVYSNNLFLLPSHQIFLLPSRSAYSRSASSKFSLLRRSGLWSFLLPHIMFGLGCSQLRLLCGPHTPFRREYAVVRTKPRIDKFVGAGSSLSSWIPQVSSKQYSAGRMKITNGLDSIETGLRVDPALYGDRNSHFYIRTNAGRSHCFDTRCGFVVIDARIVIGAGISASSKHGGPIFEAELFIVQVIGSLSLNTITRR